jgi:hypothetical protein
MATYIAVRALNRSSNVRVVADEIQKLTVDATAGQIKLTFSGQQTADIAFNATAATVQTALEALNNIAPGDIVVSGGPGNSGGTTPYYITFLTGGAYGKTDVPTITVQDGTTPASGGGDVQTVTTIQSGGNTKLSPLVDTVLDVGSAVNRRALARHGSIGQYVVTAANDFVGTQPLPANT